jgi:hypothetical protein
MAGFNALASVQEGYDFAQGLRDRRTQNIAGNALAGGDYTGAKNALYQGGMIEQGQQLDQQQSLNSYRNAQAQNLGQDNERAAAKDKLEMLGKLATGLRRVPAEARKQVYSTTVRGVLQHMNFPPEVLSQLDNAELSDQELDAFSQQVGGELQKLTLFNTTEGIVGVNPTSGDAKNLYPMQPKTQGEYRPATAQEKAAYGIPGDVPAQMGPNGKIDPISGGAAGLKQVPVKITAAHSENTAKMTQIDQAIAAVNAYPKGFGLIRGGGEGINQRVDPGGVDARAIVANIGSLIIHDRSGAAVTISEQPRLRPFIPTVTDTPEAIVKKLNGLKRQLANENDAMEISYSDGYRPFGGGPGQARSGGAMPSLSDIDAAIARKQGRR